MILLKRVEKWELEEAVSFANSIFGCCIPSDLVPQADAMIIWAHSVEDDETVYTLVDKSGEVLFEVAAT